MSTKTATENVKVANVRPGISTKEVYSTIISTGLDEVLRLDMQRPTEGGQFFYPVPMNKATMKYQKTYGLGPAKQNRDADALPVDQGGEGFSWELSVNTFRNSVIVERELLEDDLYGEIKKRQADLVESMRVCKELLMADVFNRALGTSGAPVLAEDSLYFLDDTRYNAYVPAGTWSNLESASAITPTSIYTAAIAFADTTDARGQRTPMTLKRIIIRATDEKTVWEILKSDLRPTDAMNAANFWKGRFEYTVYNMLTAALIFYLAEDPKSQKNELVWGTRTAPNIEEVDTGNPDVIQHRIRARFGPGLGRPTVWRGGTIS
jgi:hypothetical protein